MKPFALWLAAYCDIGDAAEGGVEDLDAVEDPHRAEPDDDDPVPPCPGQPVHPRRDVGGDPPGTQVPGVYPGLRGNHAVYQLLRAHL